MYYFKNNKPTKITKIIVDDLFNSTLKLTSTNFKPIV